jgi:hypothetical protein
LRVRRIRGFDLEILENFSGWVWWERRLGESNEKWKGRGEERMGWTVAVNESAHRRLHTTSLSLSLSLYAHATFTCRTWILFQLFFSWDMAFFAPSLTHMTFICIFTIILCLSSCEKWKITIYSMELKHKSTWHTVLYFHTGKENYKLNNLFAFIILIFF